MSNGRSEVIKVTKTYTAGGAITKNRFVKIDSNGEVVLCGAGEQAKGVAMETVADTKPVSVALMNAGNIVQVEAGAAVTLGAQVQSDATGRVIDTASGKLEMGQADEGAGAAAEYAIIHLTQGRLTA